MGSPTTRKHKTVEDPIPTDGETRDQDPHHRPETAHALKGEKEKCLAADMNDYLAKPLDDQALHQVLLKWIAPKQEDMNCSF